MLKAEEAAFVLRHSGARLLAVDSGMAETGRAAAALNTRVEALLWLPGEGPSQAPDDILTFDVLLAEGGLPAEVALSDADLAQIVYTSGTESAPKGAMLTHAAVIAQYVSCIADGEMRGSDVVLHSLPLYHCAQLDCFLGPAIYQGATNVITATPTPENLLPLIAAHGINSFFAPPTIWIALLRSPLFEGADLTSPAQGLLRRIDHGRSKCCARCSAGCRR